MTESGPDKKLRLIIDSRLYERADAERFGTIVGQEGWWWLVIPFNDKMKERALSDRKNVSEVYR